MNEWYGALPERWESRYLSQTCTEQCNKNIGNAEDNVLSLSYGNIIRKKSKYAGLVPSDFSTYQIVEKDNIILRLTDLQNDHTSLRTGLVKERGIITSAYCCLKPWESAEYLHYVLHAYDTQKYLYGLGGGVRQSVGFRDIRYVLLPLPPRDEQDQIVRYLDWKVSRMNALINVKRRQIALLQEQKRAVVNAALQKSEKDMPCKLKNLARFKSGTNLTSLQINDVGEYPVYGGNGLRGYYPEYSHDGEYLLVGRQGALCGNVHIVNGRFWPTDHAVTIKPFEHISTRWLYYNLVEMNLNQYSTAAAQPGLSVEVIVNLPTSFPPLTTQQRIVTELDDKCGKIDRLVAAIEREIALLHEYRTRLISDVVTGKLDVRGIAVPEYEAVEEVAELAQTDDETEADENADE